MNIVVKNLECLMDETASARGVAFNDITKFYIVKLTFLALALRHFLYKALLQSYFHYKLSAIYSDLRKK